ncbi:MAG: cyclase family protein [Acidimicrobiia bacterium]
MGPIVTRGLVIDVLGLKIAEGATDVLSQASNGRPMLSDSYRITVEDIESSLRRAKIGRIKAGDVVLFRTGWNQLAEAKDPAGAEPGNPDHSRYLAAEPGIYLREARYLAVHRPAMVGSDNWALEVLPGVIESTAFAVHQELITHYGIRIGEGMITDGLVEDGLFEFVFMINPQYAVGATAGNTPPVGFGTPRRLADPQ